MMIYLLGLSKTTEPVRINNIFHIVFSRFRNERETYADFALASDILPDIHGFEYLQKIRQKRFHLRHN